MLKKKHNLLYKFIKRFQDKALVLMYHKISIPKSDPWELAVSPDNFETHLKVLKKKYAVISIDEIVYKLKNNKLNSKEVAITFDDGLANNYFIAKPLLETYNTACSFFITDRNLINQQPFWWDELEQIILHTEQLPRYFSLEIDSSHISFDLKEEEILNEDIRGKHARLIAYEPNTLRSELYYKIWQLMSPLTIIEQEAFINQLKDWAGTKTISNGLDKCMTLDELKELAKNELFTLGAHTSSHPALGYHSKYVQFEEISRNKIFLEKALKQKINFFAYPSGNFNQDTLDIIRDLQFEAAFTTNPYPVKRKTNIFKVNRYQVNNWDKETFENKLQYWFKQ